MDVVVGGHSHTYERSFLLDSQYDVSTNAQPCNYVNRTRGAPNAPYVKPAGLTPHGGAVYVVAGTAGSSTEITVPASPVMVRARASQVA